jgi:hypothetical protein
MNQNRQNLDKNAKDFIKTLVSATIKYFNSKMKEPFLQIESKFFPNHYS